MHPNDTPKLCECGCGQPAPIAKQTKSVHGYVKGQPVRFIHGHRGTRGTIEQYFWTYVIPGPFTECWVWSGPTRRAGYGVLYFHKHRVPAHRLSWELHNGPIPDGLFVCHSCDNPPCCNPYHLFLGKAVDNVRDMDAKGRRVRMGFSGETNHAAKLTEPQVLEIRRRFAQGEQQAALAKEYGVTQTHMRRVLHGENWRHI